MEKRIEVFVQRVRDLAEHVKGNEQATKQAIIGPLFTALGWDLTDPRECLPEFRADFGQGRSVKPVDWAFLIANKPAIIVEAKEAGKSLGRYDEQLADYFAKCPEVKLGILTSGLQWRFFTDVERGNVMDREPCAVWDVLSDAEPPMDFLTLLQRGTYSSELIQTFANRRRQQNLTVQQIGKLLAPAPDFVRMVIRDLEARPVTDAVIEAWRPIVTGAVNEWARQRVLEVALSKPITTPAPTTRQAAPAVARASLSGMAAVPDLTPVFTPPPLPPPVVQPDPVAQVHVAPPAPLSAPPLPADSIPKEGRTVNTEDVELEAFDRITTMLRRTGHPDVEKVAWKDTTGYFGIHVEKPSRWFLRLLIEDAMRNKGVLFALSEPQLRELLPTAAISTVAWGTRVTISGIDDLERLRPAIEAAFLAEVAPKAPGA